MTKHKSGYSILKEKIATLEKERNEWKGKYEQKCSDYLDVVDNKKNQHDALINIMRERDKWKQIADNRTADYDNERILRYKLEDKVAFLFDHCGPICRWLYNKQFNSGH